MGNCITPENKPSYQIPSKLEDLKDSPKENSEGSTKNS